MDVLGTNDEPCDRVFAVKYDGMHLGIGQCGVGFLYICMHDAIRVQERVKEEEMTAIEQGTLKTRERQPHPRKHTFGRI